jgi:hypothetical protein
MTAEKPVDPEDYNGNPAALDRNESKQRVQGRFLQFHSGLSLLI